MMMCLVWLSVLLIGVVWLALISLLCRQIAAGKWDPLYWPPEPASRAQPVSLDELKRAIGPQEQPSSVVRARFDREGGFTEV